MIILEIIYLLLPCYIANMSPVFAKKLNILKPLAKPINEKWLGKNKTYRGFVTGIITAIIVVYLQTIFYQPWSLIPYQELNTILLGLLIGFGTLFGDAIESFFKRRLKIAPGRPFVPFDQLDSVLGALLFIYILHPLSLNIIFFSLIITFILTLLSNSIGYLLKIKDVWW
ncbi:CDP-archaeol synthase [archaeon]|nr:CDP-archaeol synthase [archaeon]MBT4416483.1 CDP-archaeol synthase [archaeon]